MHVDIFDIKLSDALLVQSLDLMQPPNCTARNKDDALRMASDVGFPLVVRPSYVLGGRAMEVVHSEEDLAAYMDAAIGVSNESPVLLDRFLDGRWLALALRTLALALRFWRWRWRWPALSQPSLHPRPHPSTPYARMR